MLFITRAKRFERQVINLVERKKWLEAEALLSENPDALPKSRSFLKSKIEHEARFFSTDTGKRVMDIDAVSERLPVHFRDDRWKITDIADVTGGLIGSKNIRITLRNRDDGSEARIFEKIYSKRFKSKANTEIDLFEEVDSRSILAPTYHGFYRGKELYSITFDYVDGPSAQDIDEHRVNAVRTLWKAKPTDRLVKLYGKRFLPALTRTMNGAAFARLARNSGAENHPFFDLDLMLGEFLPHIFEASPLCVMHGDMSPENFLSSRLDGKTYLIDWEKWQVSPIGFGTRIPAKQFDHYMELFASDSTLRSELSHTVAFGFMVAFGSLIFHIDKNRPKEAAALIPIVLREFDAAR